MVVQVMIMEEVTTMMKIMKKTIMMTMMNMKMTIMNQDLKNLSKE